MPINQSKVDQAIALISKSAANADYFFAKLKTPDWIEPLRKANLFSKPYTPIQSGEGVRFPVWVPGEYLVRMASIPEAQAQVVEILKSLPPSDNPRVYEVVADAAASLPPEEAKHLTLQLLRGLELPYQLLLPRKLALVIVRFCDTRLCSDALRLTRHVLAIAPSSPPAETSSGDDTTRWTQRQAIGRVDDWHYAQILDQIATRLVESCALDALNLMCDLLQEAVAAGQLTATDAPVDFSYIWRTAVEHSEGHGHNIRDSLVSAVRNAADQIVTSSPSSLSSVVAILRSRPTSIFHRLALNALVKHGDRDIDLVRASLAEPKSWEDTGFHPEYEILLARYFHRLSADSQQRFLDWIDKGPNLESYLAFRRRMDGAEPEQAEIQQHRDVWMRDHLGVIATDLPAPHKDRLGKLEATHGPAREIGRPHFRVTSGWRGVVSPLSDDETLSLPWSSLIARMRDWTPPTNDFDGPTVEGLARSIRQRVIANPHDAVQHLSEVVDVGPSYLSAILEGLREVIREKKELVAWQLVLPFLTSAVDNADSSGGLDRWRWVSKCAASLIDDSLNAGPASIPIQFRSSVWSVLERLAQNPDPTPEHERRYGGDNMDAATLSLNTVRGETFHAIVRYSLWWRRYLESLPNAGQYLKRGFGELPEVRLVLERHLDPQYEQSMAVRAVYGQWFPWLALLDEAWAAAHVGAIFPEDLNHADFFHAAWSTYVVFCPAYATVFPILRPVYRRAIAELNGAMNAKGERQAEHLGEHLMTFYWHGDLTTSDDLVAAFFSTAGAKLRGHALETIGRGLHQLEELPSSVVAQRLKALFDWRLEQTNVAQELEAFGWWFASGKLDDDWSMKVLVELLSKSVLPEPDHMVVERLASLAETRPTAALQCLERIVDLSSKSWSIHGWVDEARQLLGVGLKSGEEAKAVAERIIHKLGAMRFSAFRSLLNSESAPSLTSRRNS